MRQTLSGSWRKTGNRFLALLAVQIGAQMLLTSSDGEYPRAIDEGGLMSDVLPVATGQIGYPVALFILVISDDWLLHLVLILAAQMDGR